MKGVNLWNKVMKNKSLILAVTAILAVSCSTTKVLQDGQYRLASNKVEVVNDNKFNPREVHPYIKQKARGWSPFMVIYNWAGTSEKGFLDGFYRRIGIAPTVYDGDMVQTSVTNIERHLEYIGWYDSKVDAEISVKGKKVQVKYLINLGKQYPINRMTYAVPEGVFAEDFYRDTANITVKPGQILSEQALEKETVRSSAYFRNLGYYGFNKNYYFFEADTLADPSSADLEMRINGYTRNESPSAARDFRRYTFGDVDIYYPKSLKIREKVLRDMNRITPGGAYSEDIVNATYDRLAALRLFNSVNIELTQKADSPVVDCAINLSPSQLQGFKLNLEGSSNSSGLLGVSPELSFYHKNIFRGGEWLNLGFMGNFQFKPKSDIRSTEFGVSTGISIPRFLFFPAKLFPVATPRTEINASYNYQDRPEYKRNIISTSFGFTGSKGNFYYQLYPVQLNVVRLFNLDPNFYNSLASNPFMRNAYQNHFDFGLGGSLYFTTDASANPQKSYHYERLLFSTAGNTLSAFRSFMEEDSNGSKMIWNTPYSQYVRGELTLGRTWRFGKNNGQAIAARLLGGAGFAYGNSSALPFEQHFYSGGASSLRGWQARSVGPGFSQRDTTFVIPNQTGDMKLEANIEYRFNIVWKVAGAVFADAGNVWTLHKGNDSDALARFNANTLMESVAADWGVGIRLDLNFILIRVDMGMKLHDPSRTAGDRWLGPSQWLRRGNNAIHFGVGYPF